MSCGAAAEAQRLAAALYFFWYTRGWLVTGLRWLHAALAAEAQVEPLVRLRAEVGLAQLAFIARDGPPGAGPASAACVRMAEPDPG